MAEKKKQSPALCFCLLKFKSHDRRSKWMVLTFGWTSEHDQFLHLVLLTWTIHIFCCFLQKKCESSHSTLCPKCLQKQQRVQRTFFGAVTHRHLCTILPHSTHGCTQRSVALSFPVQRQCVREGDSKLDSWAVSCATRLWHSVPARTRAAQDVSSLTSRTWESETDWKSIHLKTTAQTCDTGHWSIQWFHFKCVTESTRGQSDFGIFRMKLCRQILFVSGTQLRRTVARTATLVQVDTESWAPWTWFQNFQLRCTLRWDQKPFVAHPFSLFSSFSSPKICSDVQTKLPTSVNYHSFVYDDMRPQNDETGEGSSVITVCENGTKQ